MRESESHLKSLSHHSFLDVSPTPGCTAACIMEDPILPSTVVPLLPAIYSRPGRVSGCGDGFFQAALSGKYNLSLCNTTSDALTVFSTQPASSPPSTPLMSNSTSKTLGRINSSIMEALKPSAAVEPFQPAITSRPGPACGQGKGVFQITLNGKYTSALNNSAADEISDSSLSTFQQPQSTNQRESSEIAVYFQNVRGVRTKVDELFLATCDCDYDVIILEETGLDECINSLQLFGTSYNVYRCDRCALNSRKSRFGGVLIAVAHQYISSMIDLRNGKTLEQICVSTVIKGQRINFLAVYIPPDRSQDVSSVEAHIASVQELCGGSSFNDTIIYMWGLQSTTLILDKNNRRNMLR